MRGSKLVWTALLVLVLCGMVAGATFAAKGAPSSSVGRWGQHEATMTDGTTAGVAESESLDDAVEATPEGAASSSGPNTPFVRRLVLIEVFGTDFVFVDAAEPADVSPGDHYVFHDPLFNEDRTEEVGDVHVVCTVSFGRDACHGNVQLRRGKIAFEGTVPQTAEEAAEEGFVLAITGGTGAYALARGQISGTQLEDGFRLVLTVFLI